MADQLVNEFTVNRPIDEAWGVITDVERIAPCLPGAQLQEIEGDVYRGLVKLKLGAMTFNIKGQATFMERDEATHRAVLKAEGRDTGGRGNAAAEIVADGGEPLPHRHVRQRHHRPADERQDGPVRPQRHRRRVEEADGPVRRQPQHDARRRGHVPGAPRPRTPRRTRTATAQRTTGPTRPANRSRSAPRVRKIDGPDTEPVDLAATAGPAILKRLLPLLGVLVVLVLLARRRR